VQGGRLLIRWSSVRIRPGEPNNTRIQALECTLLPFLFAIPCKFSARIYSPRRLATLWCTTCTSALFALE